MNAFQNTTGPSIARTDTQLRRSNLSLASRRRRTRKLITTTVKAGPYTLAPIGRLPSQAITQA
ncbi:hypothetical protein [Xenophilus sp. Marseille-Q4582]|uniref:hypothetical protein n=1 Tax=Xenophilus sp. Marseille-Q4582 TaxID=2866600 RepID=UPI001CE48DF4|nr:hypothetical protein [Xenophilus sp. Marseille-Q4582]